MSETDYFSPEFLQGLMRSQFPENTIFVKSVTPLEVDNSASILAVLTAGRSERLIGHFGLEVKYEFEGELKSQAMVMKIKPNGNEIVEMLNSLANACGGRLAEVYDKYKSSTGFQHTHVREQEIYSKLPSNLTPKIFGVLSDSTTDTYILLMEYLQDVELLNSVMEPALWTDQYIKTALSDIAQWHALYLDKEPSIDNTYWTDSASKDYMQKRKDLWQELLNNAAKNFPTLYNEQRVASIRNTINSIEQYWTELKNHPSTLVHNDFNPRNACFKSQGGSKKLCLYDWELSNYHLPQYDVAELLCFVLDDDRYHLRREYVEFFRHKLHELTGKFEDKGKFERGFYLAAHDFGLHRLGMYMMAHTIGPYPYLPRVVESYFDLLEEGQTLGYQ